MAVFCEDKTAEEREAYNRDCARRLIAAAEDFLTNGKVPETGKFQNQRILFEIAGTTNYGFADIKLDYKDKNIRRLSIGATDHKSGYDISEPEFKGTNSEIIEYLKTDGLAENWYNRFIKLSAKWDEKLTEYPFG